MAEPTPGIRINIPDATPAVTDQHRHWAAGLMTMMRAIGMDPAKAIGNPLIRSAVLEWGGGRMDEATLKHAMRNLLILNPDLRRGDCDQ